MERSGASQRRAGQGTLLRVHEDEVLPTASAPYTGRCDRVEFSCESASFRGPKLAGTKRLSLPLCWRSIAATTSMLMTGRRRPTPFQGGCHSSGQGGLVDRSLGDDGNVAAWEVWHT